MGRRLTAVAWLERDYDVVFADGQQIIDCVAALMGLEFTSYAPASAMDRPGPLFSIKRDGFDGEPRWPDAAWWPTPHERDDLDDPVNWWEW